MTLGRSGSTQYTENGDEEKYGVADGAIGIDENVFNGTLEELRHLAGLDKPVPPPVDFEKWGVAACDMKKETIPADGTSLFAFKQDVAHHKPHYIQVQGTPGAYVTIELLIDGIPILLRRQKVYSSGTFTYTFQRNLTVSKDDFALVTVEAPDQAPASAQVKFVLERYGE
jgi:hypothetical protein